MKIGLFGGTFDPIHLGHIEAASAARRALELDRVLLLTSRTPPHRATEPRASAFHRFAMAALAAAEYDMMVSDLELRREGPSYTALTLEALHRDGFSPSQLYFITGSDAFAEVDTWYAYPRVLELANFVIVSRPGSPRPSDLTPASARLQYPRDGARRSARRRRPHPKSPIPGGEPTMYSVETSTPNVSSTDIRHRIAAGESIEGLVPPAVADHIRRHGLYVPAHVAAAL